MKINLQDEMSDRAIKSVSRAAVAFLALGIAAAPSMFAKPKEKKIAASNLGVVAHVQLDGGAATHMVLMEKNGKEYLYVGLASSSGVCVFDVTTPAAPHKLERFAEAGGAQATDFQLVGDTLAVSSRGGEAIGSTGAAPRSVTIVNVTNPTNPQSIQTFAGVTSVVADNARGLIYLSNGEGLWIVQAKQIQKADAVSLYGG
ncbi:MAG TPA: hypothetical protein VN875_03145 [Candidatus Binatus sp.]|jgi:hypothetical protein|nr:hypothetical protein [Candidatus Binatus sp.]